MAIKNHKSRQEGKIKKRGGRHARITFGDEGQTQPASCAGFSLRQAVGASLSGRQTRVAGERHQAE